MKRIKCIIAYDGTMFAGYQVQPNKRTVQGDVEAVLSKLHKGRFARVTASGRTDAGVHAKGQVIHFDTDLNIPEEKWEAALNALLPADISVESVQEVQEDFHARFDAQGKEYRYFLKRSMKRDPFSRNFAYQYPFTLDVGKMRAASELLLGTHDFTSFCSAKTDVEDKVRTIYSLEILEDGDQLVFIYRGNGFLYNMVRILTGTLLEVGNGKRTIESVEEALSGKDRSLAGKTAPGHGLYLWEVFY